VRDGIVDHRRVAIISFQPRFDRFARSTKHLLSALEEFRSLGIQFISYQENIDTSSALGQALFTIVSAAAQLERDLIRERVSAGIRNARKYHAPIPEVSASNHARRKTLCKLQSYPL
jgi:DNA invertase Pin-like site-specific DNA recombinase